uniref:GT-D fold-like domain-containing protein n=1 Tax=Schlesneria paludicola TaxID=360056 RepID=A0A7C4QQG1_9PLAN
MRPSSGAWSLERSGIRRHPFWLQTPVSRLQTPDYLQWLDALALTSGLHPEDRDELWPLFDEACRNAPHWLVQSGWDIAERFTNAAFTSHGVGIEPDGFRYAGGLKRKIDCNAVYKLLDEGLWWSLLAGKRLAIVSGQAEAMAARLMDAEFVRATGGGDVTWSVVTAFTCPPVNEPKRTHWPRVRDELCAAEWDLLLCSAGSLSALLCEHARQAGRKALDIGALDATIMGHKS